MKNIKHPRHQLHERIYITSVEELNHKYLNSEITPDLPYDIVVSCLSSFYTVERLFGDWVDFENTGHGLYTKQQFPGFFLAVQSFLAQHRSVYIVIPQKAPVNPAFVHRHLHFIEIPEFYGIYHRIFSNYYQNSQPTPRLEKKFTMLNKRLRPSRLYSFSKCIEHNILNKGIVTLLAHGIGNKNKFDQSILNHHLELIKSTQSHKISQQTLNQVKELVPYCNSPYAEITDDFMSTGGWLPDKRLFSNSFVDVLHETHDDLPAGHQIFTEKTMRSLYLGRPFLLVGSAGSLQELHKLGFKTFSDFWDESYDYDPGLFSRQDLIFEQLIEICTCTLPYLEKIKKQMQPILAHNQARLEQLSNELDGKIASIDRYINTKRETLHDYDD